MDYCSIDLNFVSGFENWGLFDEFLFDIVGINGIARDEKLQNWVIC